MCTLNDTDATLGRICNALFYKDTEIALAWRTAFEKGSPLRDYDLKRQKCLKTANGGRIHYFPDVFKGVTVVAFCPIENWRNWGESSLDWELVPYKHNKAITVVRGIQRVLLETKTTRGGPSLAEDLEMLLSADKNRKIFFGMSFGGAMASMQSLRSHPDELVTIGALRCGDETFVRTVQSRVRAVRCYANSGDPVPKQPSACASFPLIDTGECKSHAVHGITCHGFYLGQNFTVLDAFLHAKELLSWILGPLAVPEAADKKESSSVDIVPV